MEDRFDEAFRNITLKVGQRASNEEILNDARELKANLSRYVGELSVTMNALDQLIFKVTRDPSWIWGWWTPEQAALTMSPANAANPGPVAPPRVARYNRGRRALEIAASLLKDGETVHVSDIVSQLRQEGEELDERPLATSVGNFLTRSEKWKRIDPGEYAPISLNGAN